MPRHLAPALLTPLLLLTVAACGTEDDRTAAASSKACPSPTGAVKPSALADKLGLAELGTVTESGGGSDFDTAVVVVPSDVHEATDKVREALRDAGYTVAGGEEEGVESESPFTGADGNGVAKVERDGACTTRVRVQVTLTRKAA